MNIPHLIHDLEVAALLVPLVALTLLLAILYARLTWFQS